jgi:beta-glucosidase-like glycosyl hydrolase
VTATTAKAPLFSNVPSCANDWLLKDTLHDSWAFDGYVTSDCGAVANECQPEPQGHGLFNCTEAAARSIQAGTDVDCGPIYGSQLVNAVNAGLLKESEVDASFARLTTQQMLLGLFDNDKDAQPYFNLGIGDIDTSAHRQLALEAAQQAVVLLKNDGGLLPLTPGAKNIAIIGPHFNATELLIANYHGSRCLDPPTPGSNATPTGPGSGRNYDCITSPIEAIASLNAAGGWVKGAMGCDVAGNSTAGIAAAVALASSADIVILAVGLDQVVVVVVVVVAVAVVVVYSGGGMQWWWW